MTRYFINGIQVSEVDFFTKANQADFHDLQFIDECDCQPCEFWLTDSQQLAA